MIDEGTPSALHPRHADACAILVIGDGSDGIAATLVEDLTGAFSHIEVRSMADIDGIDAECAYLARSRTRLVLGFVTSEVGSLDRAFEALKAYPCTQHNEWVVVTRSRTHTDMSRALASGLLASVISVPWTLPTLVAQSYGAITRLLLRYEMNEAERERIAGPVPDNAVRGPVLFGLDHSEREVLNDLLAGAERVLGPRPILEVGPHTDLTTQGQPVRAVHLVLDGHVALHRDSDQGDILLHHATSGPLIGLVSLARGENAFFTSTTTTPVKVVRLTNEQLQLVIAEDPPMAATLAALAIQSLARRLVRAEYLHIENRVLVDDLRHTRAELVERARYAMLGELSAGIAHELNNPITAVDRAADHLRDDITTLMDSAYADHDPSDKLRAAHEAMTRALDAHPRSTADERRLVSEFMSELRVSRQVARRLVRAGVHDVATARPLVAASAPPSYMTMVETGAQIGSSLRSLTVAAGRVVQLTDSLKGYARPDGTDARIVDVREGIEDVLRLTAHRLRHVEVLRDFEGEPLVVGHPAKLEQVWTNVLVNAAEAFEDEDEADAYAQPARGDEPPSITVSARTAGPDVVVDIVDNGPGIPASVLAKMFEPHFTTKSGRVRYGLGMGMSICRSIITDAGGTINVASQPGRTQVTIRLPKAADHEGGPTHSEHKERS